MRIVSVASIGLNVVKELLMAKRHKIGIGKSQSMFTRNAMRVHPRNAPRMTGPGGPMRGGIRL